MSTVDIGTTRSGITELTRHWPADDPWASLLIVHGLGEHSGRYERTGGLLAEAGIDTRSFDLVGFGASGGTRAFVDRWGIYQEQVLDNLAPAFNSGLPVVLMGHSLGGLIVASYALSLHRQPDLVVLSSPALEAAVPQWKRTMAPLMGKVLPKLALPNGYKGEQLSSDPAVGRDYFADPLVYTKNTAQLGSLILENIAKIGRSHDAYQARTLITHGADDTIVPPDASALLGERPSVDRKVYVGLRHETMNEPEGPEVVADIIAWIRAEVEALGR